MTNKKNNELKQLAWQLHAAGDSTRLRIICLLFKHQEMCVNKIAQQLKMSMAAVSHHLQLLKNSGLVDNICRGQTRCYKLVECEFNRKLFILLC